MKFKFRSQLKIFLFFIFIFSFINFLSFDQSLEQLITISAVGDMVFPYYFENGKKLFQDLVQYFDKDLNLGNLEGPITYLNQPAKNISSGKMFAFRFSPDIIPDLLKFLNFSAVLVANNHSYDYGEKGFSDTLKYLKEYSIEAIGLKSSIKEFTIKGKKIGIVGFYYGSRFNDLKDIPASKNLIKKAKENFDFVIVLFHGGSEGADAKYVYNRTEYFGNENRGNVFAFSHAVIDAGADLVLGSGPHILRGLELYKGKLIAYSLGNFVASGGLSAKGELSISCILSCKYDLTTNNFIEGKIIPIDLINKNPQYDQSKKSIYFLRTLTNQIYKDNYNSIPDITITDEGLIRLIK